MTEKADSERKEEEHKKDLDIAFENLKRLEKNASEFKFNISPASDTYQEDDEIVSISLNLDNLIPVDLIYSKEKEPEVKKKAVPEIQVEQGESVLKEIVEKEHERNEKKLQEGNVQKAKDVEVVTTEQVMAKEEDTKEHIDQPEIKVKEAVIPKDEEKQEEKEEIEIKPDDVKEVNAEAMEARYKERQSKLKDLIEKEKNRGSNIKGSI